MSAAEWTTAGGVTVTRRSEPVDAVGAGVALERALDERRGLLLSCRTRQPGRYPPGDVGYVDPPLEITGRGRRPAARALNARGRVLLPVVLDAWRGGVEFDEVSDDAVTGAVPAAAGAFAEEDRTRQPGVFPALRTLVARFAHPADGLLGLYGAFGYDLVFQFEPVPRRQPRAAADRDLVLHLPDAILEVDPVRGTAVRHHYDFTVAGATTARLPRATPPAPFRRSREGGAPPPHREFQPGEYAGLVALAKTRFAAGDLFEVVPGQSFHRPCPAPPSALFRRLRSANPAPYGLLANLAEGEHLVGASPEMFVRVTPVRDGGAVGRIGFDGGLDTALTLRTVQIRDGVATVRAGATLLHASDPAAEEAETHLKASALLRVLRPDTLDALEGGQNLPAPRPRRTGTPTRVLLIDHQDSFVHTLADYFRQTGADVRTYRGDSPSLPFDDPRPDLVVLSPGPGRPETFDVPGTIAAAVRRGIPVFGVRLGLQGLVSHFGGELRTLGTPVHGRSTRVELVNGGGRVPAGLPGAFEAGRYHSLHADAATLPAELMVTARADDGVIMAVEHRRLPLAAVQFHPESIMTGRDRVGHRVVANVMSRLAGRAGRAVVISHPLQEASQ